MAVPTSPPASRRLSTRLPREQRREHLLDVAAELTAEGGIEGVTMEAVALRAGVSKGLGYAYFDNAADLLVALFDREMAALDQRVADALVGAGTFEEKLRATLLAWFGVMAERGPLMAALHVPEAEGTVAARRRSRSLDVQRYWADLAVGDLGVAPRDARIAAAILIAGTNGVLDLWVARRVSRHELVDTFVVMTSGAMAALVTRGGEHTTI